MHSWRRHRHRWCPSRDLIAGAGAEAADEAVARPISSAAADEGVDGAKVMASVGQLVQLSRGHSAITADGQEKVRITYRGLRCISRRCYADETT